MVKLGMPTMVEMQSIQEGAALCRELGLDFLELNINFPQFTLGKLDVARLKEIAEEYGIVYTLHLDDEMSIADFNPYVADGYCRTVYDAVELAKQLGIQKLNMHMSRGAKYTLPDRVIYFFEAYEEEYLKRITNFRDACTAAIGDSGVMICVENTAGFLPFQQKAVDAMLESPAFGLTFDIGHNYCSGDMDEAWIRQRSARLHHMHIHDAKDGKKDHRTLGTGELDIPGYMRLAEDCGCTVVLETKTFDALRESMAWLRKKWTEDRLKTIRQAEKASHEDIYSRAVLFEKGSWLAKPVKTVLELLPLLEGKTDLRVLDLGCGIGRNCIPVAQTLCCPVDCVDILPMAIEKLAENAKQYGVGEWIHGIVSSIDAYNIQPDGYDLVLAVSALEHVDSEATLLQKLAQIAAGVKPDGIVCLIMNSGVTEADLATGAKRPPQFEVNLPTAQLEELLHNTFSGWEMLKQTVVHQRYEIPRSGTTAVVETDVVTLCARKYV